jgi:Arc/MetJ-type ribon-helix-helix transcriptional regulator
MRKIADWLKNIQRARVDDWAAANEIGSRSEAIRRLLDIALAVEERRTKRKRKNN